MTPDAKTRAAVSVAAGVAAVAASYVVAGFSPAFVGVAVNSALTTLAPGVLVAAAVQTLGSLGQPLLLVGSVCLTVGLFAAVAWASLRVARGAARPPAAAVALVVGSVLGVALGGAVASGVAAGVGAALTLLVADAAATADVSTGTSESRRRTLAAAAAVTAGLFAATLRWVGSDQSGAGVAVPAGGDTASGASDAQFGGDRFGDAERRLLDVAAERSFDVPGLDGLVTETDRFYEVDINSANPTVAAASWSLSLSGAVETELTVTFDELLARPAEHRFVTLRCVGEALNGQQIDTALWTGVPVAPLLDDAGVTANADACCVVVRAADGYFEEFPLAALREGLFAYRMNGAPLPTGHGHPVRLLVPGHWGEVNVKWVTAVEVRETETRGYWERRGWHGTGPVETVAKLHAVERPAPGRIRLAGHAYAGTRGIRRVEVSTDGGESWTTATLSASLPGRVPAGETPLPSDLGAAADAWRMWTHEYDATAAHRVVVRAVDGTGEVQSRDQSGAFPSGATGWVSRRVRP
jgi:DMSO/TMAO reductase YedYZ molybdopterin-dependent catalytic subunit